VGVARWVCCGVIFSVAHYYHALLGYLLCVSMLSTILPPPSAVTTDELGDSGSFYGFKRFLETIF